MRGEWQISDKLGPGRKAGHRQARRGAMEGRGKRGGASLRWLHEKGEGDDGYWQWNEAG